ncbi:MAG: hypothetical protein O3B22_03775 [Proteobacteria bacterium]|jgi:uncharacterized membrane protein|nr:hypothetical protein [Pseudomonadota bacterium]
MSENGRQVVQAEPSGYPMAIYILYLASFVTGITWLIGGVMAILGRNEAPAWQASHLRFQVRTFWIGLLFGIISGVTVPLLGLGILLGALTTIWIIVRCIKGILWLQQGASVPDPASWAFGGKSR